MNTLKSIQTVVEARMKERSGKVYEELKRALSAVYHLHDQGVTVQSVEIHADRVLIKVDKPGRFLAGAIRIRRSAGDCRETVSVARVLDCQVEWVTRDSMGLLSGRA